MRKTFQNISYTKVGRGPHLCFLHGFCENSDIWSPIVDHLQETHTCLSIDLPGFGNSAENEFPSIENAARLIRDVLQYEEANDAIVFGHSLGGYVLAEYIALFGSTIKAAGFIHSTAREDTAEKKVNRKKSINFIEKHGTSEFFRLFVPSLVAPENLDRLRLKLTEMVQQTSKEAVSQGLKSMMTRKDHVLTLSSFDKPILFLKGIKDKHYPELDIYNQASQCSLVQVSVIDDAGHLSMYETPSKCLTAIEEFIQFSKTF